MLNDRAVLPSLFYDVGTPSLVLDLDRVLSNLETLRGAFAGLRPSIFFSVKANGDPRLLAALHEHGSGFDVASICEIRRLQGLGVPPSRITFSSTVKVPEHIAEAHALGVERFAFDSQAEVDKLARHAPGARVSLRLEVPHTGSRWPLAGKFGAAPAEALPLLGLARVSGLDPDGLTFHVGSQCLRVATWLEALRVCARVWAEAAEAGIQLRLVNVGGGLPTRYTEAVPTVTEIARKVVPYVQENFGPDVELAIEPGRHLVGDAGTLVTTVIGTACRRGKPWVFVDQSIYSGLLEVIGGWTYPIITEKDYLPKRRATLAGPSCDSTDIIASDVDLPELEVGDRLLLLSAGAYTSSYREYNGFPFPEVVMTGARAGLAVPA
ncbi:MAG TPA: type III PLP-dependent enzyme [Chloroflexota bacterium]